MTARARHTKTLVIAPDVSRCIRISGQYPPLIHWLSAISVFRSSRWMCDENLLNWVYNMITHHPTTTTNSSKTWHNPNPCSKFRKSYVHLILPWVPNRLCPFGSWNGAVLANLEAQFNFWNWDWSAIPTFVFGCQKFIVSPWKHMAMPTYVCLFLKQ